MQSGVRLGDLNFAIDAGLPITSRKRMVARAEPESALQTRKSREVPMSSVRVLATDLEFPEGPVVMPDGSVVLVEIRGRRLTRVWPDGRKEVVAEIPGGPNGAAIGPDGKCYICNNGGFSWIPSRGTLMPGPPSAAEYIGGSIQRIDLISGKVETLFDKCGEHPLKGPNDLVFERQGGLWFTDLGKRRARDMDVGAVYYMKPALPKSTEQVFGMPPPTASACRRMKTRSTPRRRRPPGCGLSISPRRARSSRDVIYRGSEASPSRGSAAIMLDLLAVEASRLRLRRDAGLRLHLGDRARWRPSSSRCRPVIASPPNIAFGGLVVEDC